MNTHTHRQLSEREILLLPQFSETGFRAFHGKLFYPNLL